MYILELFIKWINKNKRGEGANPDNILSSNLLENQTDDAFNCEHKFMPLDSTKNILACIKCGYVIKKNENYKG